MDPLRYKGIKGYACTIFRKNANQITQAGGLWDESLELYSQIKGAVPRITDRLWLFNDRDGNLCAKVSFKHIERDADVHSYQGGQITAIFYDELCHFSEYTFFYMLSRNRSTCGVRPYIRATCNPDPDSWVRKFIDWWIDPESGYPIKERSGVIRWMVRMQNTIYWGDTKEELWERFNLVLPEEKEKVKSVTFIPALLSDNPALMAKDPGYRANLESLPEVEREQLLHGNWNIRAAGGLIFKRSQVEIISEVPKDIIMLCRAWDIAATEKKEKSDDPDFTAGVLMGKRKNGRFVIIDVINQRIKASDVEKLILNTAVSDRAKYGHLVRIRIPIDPGGAGKIVADAYVKMLAGFSVKAERVTGSKVIRANPFAAQWQMGNVDIVSGDWNAEYFNQLEYFPDGKHDDMVDGSSDSFNELAQKSFNLSNLTR